MSHSSSTGTKYLETFAECEPPDLCIWRLHGDVGAEHIEKLYAVQQAFLEGKDFIFVLVDLSNMQSISPEARKAAKQDRGYASVRATATCGGSFALRSLAMLIAKTMTILYPKGSPVYQAFDTEEEARAWFSQVRDSLISGSAKG